jgi:hypothetical protein
MCSALCRRQITKGLAVIVDPIGGASISMSAGRPLPPRRSASTFAGDATGWGLVCSVLCAGSGDMCDRHILVPKSIGDPLLKLARAWRRGRWVMAT